MVSLKAVGPAVRVVFSARSFPALWATLSRDSAFSGPRWRYILYRQLSIFVLKIAPGEIPSSAEKRAL